MKISFRRKKVVAVKPILPRNPGPCLNCGTYLSKDDVFCSHCGQKRVEREEMTFHHLIGDSFLDYFHFDSKFFRTILPLLYRPGLLSLEYMKGRRKSYVEPFKLFLVISVIFFLLLPFRNKEEENAGNAVSNNSQMKAGINKNTKNNLKFTLNGISISNSAADSIRKEVDTIGLKAYVGKHFANASGLTKIVISQTIKIMVTKGQSFTTVLEHTASKMIFLFIPIFAILLKLFYIRRKRLYFEHLIFSLHLHAFIFFLFILYLMIEQILPLSLWFVLLIVLVYGFIALKKYYDQGYGKTLSKMMLLSLSYLVICIPLLFMVLMLVALLTF